MEGKSSHIITRLMVLLMPVVLIILQVWHPNAALVGLTKETNCGFLTYHFFHANWFHLALNWWCLTGLVLNYNYKINELLWALIIASLYPFATDVPILGMSGIIFAMAGMATNRWIYVTMILLSIAMTAFMPHMAVGLHLWCYILGLGCGYLNHGIQR